MVVPRKGLAWIQAWCYHRKAFACADSLAILPWVAVAEQNCRKDLGDVVVVDGADAPAGDDAAFEEAFEGGVAVPVG